MRTGEDDRTWYCDDLGLRILESDGRNIFKLDGITFGLEFGLESSPGQLNSGEGSHFQIVFSGKDKFDTVPKPTEEYSSTFVLDGSSGQSKLINVNGSLSPASALALERNENLEAEWAYFVNNERPNLGQLHIYEPQEIRYPPTNSAPP